MLHMEAAHAFRPGAPRALDVRNCGSQGWGIGMQEAVLAACRVGPAQEKDIAFQSH
jgi:hypothetical protein